MSVDTASPPARESTPAMHFAAHSTRQPVRLTPEQTAALEDELHPSRVAFDFDGFGHVQGWDVRATLTRIFGFGMWSEEITERELIGEPRQINGKWYVSWAVSIRLTCWDQYGAVLGPYEGTTIETSAGLPQLGDAHGMARKGAATVALKRAAINLGNQFGLSLYRGPAGAAQQHAKKAGHKPAGRAVSSTLAIPAEAPAGADPGDRGVVEVDVTDTRPPAQPEPPAPTTGPAPAPAAALPPAPAPNVAALKEAARRIVPKGGDRPPAAGDDQTLIDARKGLRDLALSLGVDPDAFDAAVIRRCGVPLDRTTVGHVRAMRDAIERRQNRG